MGSLGEPAGAMLGQDPSRQPGVHPTGLYTGYGTPAQHRIASVFAFGATADLHAYHSGRLPLPHDGTYTVVVRGATDQSTGHYAIQVFPIERAPEILPGEVAIGDTIDGEPIFPKGDVDEFAFTGSADQSVEVFLQPLAGGGTLWLGVYELRDTGSRTLIGSTIAYPTADLEEHGTGTLELPRDGTYLLVIQGYTICATAEYRLRIRGR
jgi:hypothetical protein